MKGVKLGFFVESLSVIGPGKPNAQLTFSDGLNVVAGASDTGKSFALSCLDFTFGSSSPPRRIHQLDGYKTIVSTLVARRNQDKLTIERPISGGDVRIVRSDSAGNLLSDDVCPFKHTHDEPKTLSGTLLELSGLWGKRVRKNAAGEQRSLSFRDVAFLCLVDEERIIAEKPPQQSGNFVTRTAENDVLRLLITGVEHGGEAVAPRKKTDAVAIAAQIDLLHEMIGRMRAEFDRLGLNSQVLNSELDAIDGARRGALAQYESIRDNIAVLEGHLSGHARALRDVQSRALVVDGLLKRFDLLMAHYESDINRLSTIRETGRLLETFPSKPCPLCGAAPDAHRSDNCEEQFRLSDVQAAAEQESSKIEVLKRDLKRVIEGLLTEQSELEDRRTETTSQVNAVQGRISNELTPRIKESLEALESQRQRRELLMRGKALLEQAAQLQLQVDELTGLQGVKHGRGRASSLSTGEMESFTGKVELILREWNYPDSGRVVFSEGDQDLLIGGHPRAAHGKGVRALTCAAFITALLRHCCEKELPHPSLVALDSPLVAYKEPDTSHGEAQMLRQAGVKEAFYKSLASNPIGQVIVFENEDPPTDLKGVRAQHFTKGLFGRYGFFPVDFSSVEIALSQEPASERPVRARD
jgi:hypothetical protein